MNVLYSEFLEYDPQNPLWESRDRFFLDPGHMSTMLYSTLALSRKYTLDELQQFRQWGSVTPGHPERCVARGIENTSGPLGQGHEPDNGRDLQESGLHLLPNDTFVHRHKRKDDLVIICQETVLYLVQYELVRKQLVQHRQNNFQDSYSAQERRLQ